MRTFIIELYGGSISNHFHHHYQIQQSYRRHPQQQRHYSSHNSSTLLPFCTHTPEWAKPEHFVSGATLRSSSRSTNALAIVDLAPFKNCPAVFLIALVLMTSCNDVRGMPIGYSGGSAGSSERPANELQTSEVNSSTPATFHSSFLMASVNTSSSSSSRMDIPGVQQSTHYIVSNADGNTHVHQDPISRAELINVLISTLEKLKVLQVRDSSCFRLEKIVRKYIVGSSSSLFASTTASPSKGHNSFGVFLYFDEVHIAAINSSHTVDVNMSTGSSSSSRGNESGLHKSCEVEPVVELEDQPLPGIVMTADNDGNGTAIVTANEEGFTTEMGISRTHIVVISTCSAIIGMFFLAAAVLRIRNYIKRARLEQEMSNRPKFRSCSVALRGATQSMEQLRRDSMISKTSHQHSDTTKGSNGSHTNGSSRENSSSSSPRHDPDTAPLLLLPRGAQLADPPAQTEVDEKVPTATAGSRKKAGLSPDRVLTNIK